MNRLLKAIYETSDLSPLKRKEAVSKYLDEKNIDEVLEELRTNPEAGAKRAILRFLIEVCGAKAVAQNVDSFFSENSDCLHSLIKDEDPKVRKSTYELVGKLNPDKYCHLLISVYNDEKIRFTLPSLILSIGRAKKSEDAKKFISELYRKADPKTQDKNEKDIYDALKKAKDSLSERPAMKLKADFETPVKIITDSCNARVTTEIFKSRGFEAKTVDTKAGLSSIENIKGIKDIYTVRTFYDFGIYLGTADSFVNIIKSIDFKLILRTLKNIYGTERCSYRIDLRGNNIGPKDKKNIYTMLSGKLEKFGLSNSASSYDFEIRIQKFLKGYIITLVPSEKNDPRFFYRKKTISASMHPSVAASCIAVAKKYLKETDSVIDPFCGSGTFLFERAVYKNRKLTGTDISKEAIAAAKENLAATKLTMSLFTKDATSEFSEKYDEVICNMPFGLRVSSHKENEKLYLSFVNNLYNMLSKTGHGLLFTNDKALLADKLNIKFNILEKYSFQAGGLYPSLYIVEKK